MFACLPFIGLVLLFLILHNSDRDWRYAVLAAAVIWGVLLTVFTELLSLLNFITFGSILGIWLATAIALGAIYYRLVKHKKRSLPKLRLPRLTPVLWVLLAGILFITIALGTIALIAPPNTWDSMTYHMTRVVHWIQNRNVAHYPTYFSAQLVHPPFAEFAIMHLQILSRGDRLANLVQWLSMVGSVIGVSAIAKQLGANLWGQWLAAIFCATMPMGILQASSTQNDYVVAFWLVCLAHYTLLILPHKIPPTGLVAGVGASVGLAVLTKSSGYIYAFPFMVWLFLWYANRLRWKLWKPIVIVSTIFFGLNLNHYLRNYALYGNPIATAEYSEHYRIEVYSFPTWISNIVRNLALHADIVRHLGLQGIITPITGKVDRIVDLIHSLLEVSANDPRTTFPAGAYRVPGLSFDENIAGNPLHLFLILIAIAIFIFYRKLDNKKQILAYLLSIIGGFFLLCLMLKVQQFHARHHVSLFVLLSAFVGVIFSKLWHRYLVKSIAIASLAVILLVTSMPWVLGNTARPILGEQSIFNTSRNELYFINRKFLKTPYFETVELLKTTECTDIGLSLGAMAVPSGTYWEYPFWALFSENKGKSVRFEHILNPENMSYPTTKTSSYQDFVPCAIVAVRKPEEDPVEEIVFQGNTYRKKWSVQSLQPISILTRS